MLAYSYEKIINMEFVYLNMKTSLIFYIYVNMKICTYIFLDSLVHIRTVFSVYKISIIIRNKLANF